jgi:hypothetical protein
MPPLTGGTRLAQAPLYWRREPRRTAPGDRESMSGKVRTGPLPHYPWQPPQHRGLPAASQDDRAIPTCTHPLPVARGERPRLNRGELNGRHETPFFSLQTSTVRDVGTGTMSLEVSHRPSVAPVMRRSRPPPRRERDQGPAHARAPNPWSVHRPGASRRPPWLEEERDEESTTTEPGRTAPRNLEHLQPSPTPASWPQPEEETKRREIINDSKKRDSRHA